MHRSGFINIIGNPNVGKSTLMNALVGERMSIINRKPQTTRHRIIGIVSDDDYQIVFSDTPGHIDEPHYALHASMNRAVRQTFEDADLMLYVTTVAEEPDDARAFFSSAPNTDVPVFLVLNKIDLATEEEVHALITRYESQGLYEKVFGISALNKLGTDQLMSAIIDQLPEGPAYYPKDQLSDRPERFFVSEIVRDHILSLYHQEVPYSCEVDVESFKVTEDRKGPITKIRAIIYVSRKSQKGILIGKGGKAIKELGIRARKDIEVFLESRVHLELYVKVRENWRDDDTQLRRFGY